MPSTLRATNVTAWNAAQRKFTHSSQMTLIYKERGTFRQTCLSAFNHAARKGGARASAEHVSTQKKNSGLTPMLNPRPKAHTNRHTSLVGACTMCFSSYFALYYSAYILMNQCKGHHKFITLMLRMHTSGARDSEKNKTKNIWPALPL